MNQDLKKAIRELNVDNKLIRKKTLETIRANREEATEYFLQSLDAMIDDPMTENIRIIDESFFGVFFFCGMERNFSI